MLLRRALLSRDIPKIVTIPLLGSFTASNGAEPSVNTGCSLEADGLYIPKGKHVEYKLSDLYPKDFNKLTLEIDLMYTNTASTHGYFSFFDINAITGVNYNDFPRELFYLFDCRGEEPFPKNTYIHMLVSADFSHGKTYPHGEIEGLKTRIIPDSYNVLVSKPSVIYLGEYDIHAERDTWQGYVRNVKVTFE